MVNQIIGDFNVIDFNCSVGMQPHLGVCGNGSGNYM